jgi:hypothetical protein
MSNAALDKQRWLQSKETGFHKCVNANIQIKIMWSGSYSLDSMNLLFGSLAALYVSQLYLSLSNAVSTWLGVV